MVLGFYIQGMEIPCRHQKSTYWVRSFDEKSILKYGSFVKRDLPDQVDFARSLPFTESLTSCMVSYRVPDILHIVGLERLPRPSPHKCAVDAEEEQSTLIILQGQVQPTVAWRRRGPR